MKFIEDYTNQELLKLSDGDVERIIKLTLANNGLQIPRKPEEPKYHELPEKDKSIYSVKGVDIFFYKKEVAEEIAKVLRNNFSSLSKREYSYTDDGINYLDKPLALDFYFKDGAQTIVVEEMLIYSMELFAEIKQKQEENRQMKKDYDEKKKAYDLAVDESSDISSCVWDKVHSARKEEERKKELLGYFKEYLELADGKNEIAWKFMHKAFVVSDEEKDYINSNI